MTQSEIKNSSIHNQKRLSVQVSLNGLSFLISNELGEKFHFEEVNWNHSITPEELLIEFEKLFLKLPDNTFSEIKVIYSTPAHTVVPESLFDESKGSEYLKFSSKILINDYVANDELETEGLRIVYVPYMNINNAIFEKFGSFDYFHTVTVLLKTFFNHHKQEQLNVYVHVRESFFDCIILDNGKLQLCNSYPYTSPEDFLYYLLFVMEQLELDPDNVEVLVCGKISKDDPLYSLAYDYIRNISFFEDGEEQDDVPFILKQNT